MAHKARYNQTRQKKTAHARAAVPPQAQMPAMAGAPAPMAAAAAAPEEKARPAPRPAAVAASIPTSVKYAGLPRELGWLGLLSLATIVLLFILWLIFR